MPVVEVELGSLCYGIFFPMCTRDPSNDNL